jgi:hypothetical protein
MEMEKQNIGLIATGNEGDRKVKYGARYRKVPHMRYMQARRGS